MNKKNHARDAMLLTGIRLMSILINIVSSAILSRMLELEVYGTYSAGNLVVSVAANLTILGMMDAANFFYNQEKLPKKDCINTIGFLQTLIGLVCAAVIIGGRDMIAGYFDNPQLRGLCIYIALRPLLENLSNSLLSLQMCIGKARAVGIRNGIFSLCKLLAVLLTVFVTRNIRTIFLAYLIMDGATVYYYYRNFKKAAFGIDPLAFRKELIAPVLRFAVPMGIYMMTNSLSRDLDKLVIGYFESTEQLAVYSNCATLLPFGIVSSAFLTIIVPIVTRLVQQEEMEPARRLFRNYLSIGFISTSILTVTCMVLSEEAILLLYGEKYLSGKWIFILYIIVDLVRFANTSLVLSAKGKTGTLVGISAGMLALNALLNLVLYRWMGILGPAVATVVTTLTATVLLLRSSARILQTSLALLVDWKLIGRMCVLLLLFGGCGVWLRGLLAARGVHYAVVLVLVGALLCGSLLLVNLKRIKGLFRGLNSEGIE